MKLTMKFKLDMKVKTTLKVEALCSPDLGVSENLPSVRKILVCFAEVVPSGDLYVRFYVGKTLNLFNKLACAIPVCPGLLGEPVFGGFRRCSVVFLPQLPCPILGGIVNAHLSFPVFFEPLSPSKTIIRPTFYLTGDLLAELRAYHIFLRRRRFRILRLGAALRPHRPLRRYMFLEVSRIRVIGLLTR